MIKICQGSYVAQKGRRRKSYRTLVGKHCHGWSVWRPTWKWEGCIKM